MTTVIPFNRPANDEDSFVQTITITVTDEGVHISTEGFETHFEEIGVLMTAVNMVLDNE